MSSVNKVIIIGNLGKEIRRSGNEASPVANFTVATNHSYRGRDGQMVTETEWHRVAAFNQSARYVLEYGASGRQIYVEGRLRTRKWTDQQGVERYATEIIAESVNLLGAPKQGGDAPSAAPAARAAEPAQNAPVPAASPAPDALDDDIPF